MPNYYANTDSSGNITAFYADDVWDVSNIPISATPITVEQWQDAIANQGKYQIINGIFTLTPPPSADIQLASAKQNKINELLASAAIALQTFTSTALGATPLGATPIGSTPVEPLALTYLCGTNDMLMLEAEDRFMNSTDWDGNPILWYTVELGDVEHDKISLHKVYLDGRLSVQSKKYKAKSLVAKVSDIDISDTVTLDQALAQIDAINWSYP